KLSAFFVADVTRRRADQSRHGVSLHVFAHVDADHRVLVIEQKFRERARELSLTDPGWPQKNRSEEHTSELQSPYDLVCRLLLESYAAHRDLHSFPTRRSSDLKLSAFFVADVTRRRADQSRHGVSLHVFAHVDADHRVLVIEQKFRERARELSLTDPGWPQKN